MNTFETLSEASTKIRNMEKQKNAKMRKQMKQIENNRKQ